jgi:adenylate cyclase
LAEEQVERRLAAIMAADVVGYSRLMEANEERTLGALRQHRREFLDPTVAKHRGRIFKVMGDGFLVEFGSVLNAVRCAVEIQTGMHDRNAGIPDDRQIKFRMGINVGDIMVDGEDFYGEGVNIAARLETLAEPGGVSISAMVHHSLGNRIDEKFTDTGEHQLKNIARPIRVWQWTGPRRLDGAAAAKSSGKSSILILPFTNMSGDPTQEYFADGLTEDFITELSRYKGLRVLARHTAFHYKGRSPKIEELQRELGVAYVLEGSIRRLGNRVRVTAQLIDAAGGAHVWAERYDRDLSDVFAVQDELIAAIATSLEGRMISAGAASAQRKPTANWNAYDYFLKGRDLGNAHREDEAAGYFAKAIDLDPDFAQAHAWQATCLVINSVLDLRPALLEEARLLAERALALDATDASSHHAMGMVCLYSRQFDAAGKHFNRATALNPHDVSISGDRAQWLRFSGKLSDAHAVINAAIERDPFPPVWLFGVRGAILFHLGRYRQAIDDFSGMQNRRFYNVMYYVAALIQSSAVDAALREAGILRRIKPGCTISSLTGWLPVADVSMLELLVDGLKKAGITE